MKHLIFLVLLIITSVVHSQSLEDNTSITIVSSPGSWDDGFNIGVGVEHQTTLGYIGIELFAHPWLNATKERELSYYHAICRVGLSFYLDDPDWGSWRTFTGLRVGGIMRGGDPGYANIGGELGIEYTIPGAGVFFRVAGSIDSATDSKHWSKNDNHTRHSVWGSFGFKF